MPRFHSWVSRVVVVCFLTCFAGCGRDTSGPREGEAPLRQLAVVYGRFQAANKGRAPSNLAEFKEFAKTIPKADLERLQITEVNGIFTSPRDRNPYVIRFQLSSLSTDPAKVPVIAHEQVGVDGKKMVALANTSVEEVDEQGLKELLARK